MSQEETTVGKTKKPLSKKAKIIIISVASVVALAVALTLILYFTLRPVVQINLSTVSVSQVDNEQYVLVDWHTAENVDKVEITVKNSDKEVLSSVTISNPSAIARGYAYLEVSYGRQTVELIASNASGTTKSISKQVDVFTDEYVIAPLVATMPVTFFSLNLAQYSNNYSIPTFVWLQRGGAWNYANMHNNVYLIPSGNYSEMATYSDPVKMYEETSKWIKELYEINPQSKFHLYYNDFHPWGWMQATVANNIPTDNYDVTLLSDGTGSYYTFSKYLCRDNSKELFVDMCKTYNKLKEQISKKGSYSHKDITLAIKSGELRNYVMCMLTEEPNVSLVLARDFITNDMPKDNPMRPEFLKLLVSADNPNGKIKIERMYDLLTAMTEEERADLQNLYHFSDSMFEKAVEENKKVMVLLGTRTDLETNFDGLVKATMAYYGDEYVYYYKGHPGTPTQMDDAKAQRLEELGLIDVDSTIAAELIFFFNQEACATGYGSSTYNSLLDGQVCGVWANGLDSLNSEYKDKVDFALFELKSSHPVYGSLASGDCYLFEFADTTYYDVAVYYESQDTIRYYKLDGNQFLENVIIVD